MPLIAPPHLNGSAVLEQISDGYVALDRDWRSTYVTPTAAQTLGRAPADLLGREFWSVFPGLPDGTRRHLQRAMDRGEAAHLQLHDEALGTWLRLSVYPTTEGVSIYTTDDTARHRSLALRQQLDTVNVALTAAGSARDVAQSILAVALPGLDAFGGLIALAEPGGTHLRMTVADGYAADLTAPWQSIAVTQRLPLTDSFRSGEALYLSEQQVRRTYPTLPAGSGSRSLVCLPLVVDRACIGVLGLSFAHDLRATADERAYHATLATCTAQAMQRALQLEEQRAEAARHQLLLRTTGTLLWSGDAQLRFNDRNTAWLEFTGLSAEASSLTATPGVLHPDDRDAVLDQAARGVRSGEAFVIQGRVRRWDRQFRDLESHVEPVRNAAGQLTGWIGVLQDVTERAQAARFEATRRQVLDHLSALSDHRQLMTQLCEEARLLTRASRVSLWQWQAERRELRILATAGHGAERPDTLDAALWGAPYPADTLTAVAGDRDWTVQPLAMTAVDPAQVSGTFGLVYRRSGALQGEERHTLNQLGSTLSSVLQRALVLQHLEAREQKYRTIVESLHEAVVVVEDPGRFRSMNTSATTLLNVPWDVQGTPDLGGWAFVRLDGRALDPGEDPVQRSLRGERVMNVLLGARHPHGMAAWWQVSAAPLPAAPDGTRKAVITLTDVTAQTELQRQLAFHAAHDDLTGLHNRRAFATHVDAAALRSVSGGQPLAVVQLGFDRFKSVSDTLGQQVGDEFLRLSAQRLTEALGGRGVAASLNGDQFGVAVPVRTSREGARLAGRLRAALGRPARILAHDVQVTVSAGLSVAPHDGASAPMLMRNADLAMHRAKQRGRDALVVFSETLGHAHQRHRDIEVRLRRAQKRGELHLAYQPVVALASGTVVGSETLVRWDSRDLGPVNPSEFIPVAEDTGQIVALGSWILRSAAQQSVGWPAALATPFRLSVNVSPLQFVHPTFLSVVDAALDASGLDPRHLDLEITESAVMDDLGVAHTRLTALRGRGVRVTLDDFGTGHSSLGVLDALPFDRIKLDRQFVWGVEGSAKRRELLRSVLGMARALDLEVVAEGIETVVQRDLLLDLGCALGQGYLYSPPLGPAAFAARYFPHVP